MNKYNSVIFDVDSTLSGIEGIDWLAALRGPEMQAWSASLTERAMKGELAIEAVYGERMNAVRPSQREIEALGHEYVARVAPGARQTLAELRRKGIHLVMVSGGLREAIIPLARELGITDTALYAVSVYFDKTGGYAGFESASPMTRQEGKRLTVGKMGLKPPTLAVGDGMTDSEMKPVVTNFAAFTGFTRRQPVIERADFVVDSFDQLRELILK
ncbi:MAG TPA: HAD-IB family phosphatase [Gemmatimonadaceae bacterium]|nr:HAD-IB family phosphatase [Gemmatimonadaceae bacterium]